MKKLLTITLDAEDWVEIVCTLDIKAMKIAKGAYGPEEKPGEDKRWIDDLVRIRKEIESVLYGQKKRK